jgi:hypothetical protein
MATLAPVTALLAGLLFGIGPDGLRHGEPG